MAYVKRVSHPFTIDHARRCIGSKLETPPDDLWWGAVTKEAISRGLIRKVDFAPSSSSNGSPKPTYVKGAKTAHQSSKPKRLGSFMG